MAEVHKHRILLVDDEIAITKSLYRLFRKEGYHIDMCDNGAEGLKIIETSKEPFSLIISDQRMPGMSGSQFLEKASELAPHALRFLLTGYSDLEAVVDAVNKGKIQRYLTKPWNDEGLLLHVRQAIEEVELRRENERLTLLTQRQNKQLYEFGVSLDKKVKDRTEKLKESNRDLEALNRQLEGSFLSIVRLLLSLVDTTNKVMGRYMRHVGRLSKSVAIGLGLPDKEVEKIEIAGALHDIGMLGLPETVLYRSESELVGDDLRRYKQHPVVAAISLETVDRLFDTADIVLHHHERYDGKGFPDRLRGDAIPVGSRILAVVSDYCRIMNYWPKSRQVILKKISKYNDINFDAGVTSTVDEMLQDAAEKILLDGCLKKYDAAIVGVLLGILRKSSKIQLKDNGGIMPIEELQAGMVLSQDVFLIDGRMLLSQSTVLDAATVQSLQKIWKMKMLPDTIFVSSREA